MDNKDDYNIGDKNINPTIIGDLASDEVESSALMENEVNSARASPDIKKI